MSWVLKKSAWSWLLCIATLLLFSSCAWIPEGGKPAQFIETPSLGHAVSSNAIQSKHPIVPQQWPKQDWWQEFGSNDLNTLMQIALKGNPGLKATTARLRQAQALVRVEGARLLPFLEADVKFANEMISQHGVFAALNHEVAGANIVFGEMNPLSFRYEFDFWGKNRAALEAAIGEAKAQEAEWAEAKLRLTSNVARAYFRGLALREQLALIERTIEIRRELLLIAETRFQIGLEPKDLIKQASIELEKTIKREAVVRDELDIQRNLLTRLLASGSDATGSLLINSVSILKDPPLPQNLPLELLSHRPDLASALYRAEAAGQRIKVAEASFLPTIDLMAFAGFNALRLTKGADALANLLFSGSSFSYGIAPGLRLPWFEGGRLRGELSAQRAEYDAAVELYNDTLLKAVQDIADSLSRWKESRAIVEAQQRLLVSQNTDQNLAEDRFRIGVDDRRLTLNRQQSVFDQEYVLKSLETNHLIARVDVIEALGGGYANDLQLIRQEIKHMRAAPEESTWYKRVWFLMTEATKN